MHLTSDELLDLAEGTRPVSSAPHLTVCEACRHELNELRGVMATLNVEVPEPSPLFWDHFSTRLREAVAAEASPARSWLGMGRWSWGLAAAISAVVIALAVSSTVRTPQVVAPAPASVAAEPGTDVVSAAAVDDPSFSLLGDLADGMDWDTAADAGISMAVGTADEAVVDLDDQERVELQRLLREEMATRAPGA